MLKSVEGDEFGQSQISHAIHWEYLRLFDNEVY